MADLNAPIKTGYTFTGWSCSESSLPAGDITLTATYMINSYLVTFDTNGGKYIRSIYVGYDSLINAPDAEKMGYEFSHYTYNGEEIDLKTFKMPSNDITLTAAYSLITYDIIYDLMYIDSQVKDSYNVATVKTLMTPERKGYTFVGWYLKEDYIGDKVLTTAGFAEHLELYAKWELNTYSIKYSLNGGTNGDNPTSYTVEAVVEFNDPSRIGYTFVGWYLDSEYTVEITDTTDYAENLVLYAKWSEALTYTVTFNSNGGSEVSSITYTVESHKTFETPTKAGYTFVGWYLGDKPSS